MHAVVIFEVKTHGSAGKMNVAGAEKGATSLEDPGSVKRRKGGMRKNGGKNEPAAKGEAHGGAKSSWLDLTNLDHRQPNSSVLSAQRHQHLTVRGAGRGLARFSETDRERSATPC
jgi:hypothetical protein